MKTFLLFLLPVLLASCAGMHVTKTYVSSGETNPKGIYIRPFSIAHAEVRGHHCDPGELPIRTSIIPTEFANDLRHELSLITPAMVIANDEVPTSGWLVEGRFDVVDAGNPVIRGIMTPTGLGRSRLMLHVRIIDTGNRGSAEYEDAKDIGSETQHAVRTKHGRVVYEFDMDGGSNLSGCFGTLRAPGYGYATDFDLKNAAERIRLAVSPNPFSYGDR